MHPLLTLVPLILAALVCGASAQPSTAEPTARLIVIVRDADPMDSLVEVNLWQGADGWLDRDSDRSLSRTATTRAETGVAEVVFEGLARRDYAVTAFQDDNGNGSLDTGMFRIPREKLGFSNNVRPRFRSPPYEAAAVELDEETLRIEIRLVRMP